MNEQWAQSMGHEAEGFECGMAECGMWEFGMGDAEWRMKRGEAGKVGS